MMKMLVALTTTVLLAVPASSANMLVNGDFEVGDLTGWHEEGPSYYHWKFQNWMGFPIPAQVFSADVPMSLTEVEYDRRTVRHVRPRGLVSDVVPRERSGNDWAMGWTRTGWDHFGIPWISQTFHVAPGKYLMNASWEVTAWSTLFKGAAPHSGSVAGMFMVHVDKHVNEYTLDERAFRKTVWDNESKGEWVRKSIAGFPIETKRGLVEVRLEYLQGTLTPHAVTAPLPYPEYEYVAFDNVYFDLVPVPDDPEVAR